MKNLLQLKFDKLYHVEFQEEYYIILHIKCITKKLQINSLQKNKKKKTTCFSVLHVCAVFKINFGEVLYTLGYIKNIIN